MTKLSLGLTKYHARKTNTVRSYAPLHEDVWGYGGIAPSINLGSKWR